MVNALDSRASGLSSSPGQGHCVVFLGKHFSQKVNFSTQARVVQKVDNVILWTNHYPVDSVVCFVDTYPLDSDLSGG